MSVERCEIAVVGAGPAGATLAALAARAGHDVCLIEGSEFPRDRVGESIAVECVRRLDALGLPSPLRSSPPPWRIGAMRVTYRGGGRYLARFEEELRHFLIRRAGFDQALLGAAQAAGARLVRGRARAVIAEGAQ